MTRARDVANIDGVLTTTGDTYYASAAATPARLGIGSTGQVMTVAGGVPSWAAPAASGANWSLLNAGGTALTGAATVTISGISGADKIMVLVAAASSANASAQIRLRLNTDTASNYYWTAVQLFPQSTFQPNIVTSLDSVAAPETHISIGTMSANALAASTINGYVLLQGCNSAGVKMFNSAGGGTNSVSDTQRAFMAGGYYDSASTISSISINSSSGNLDAGSVFVFTSA